MTAQQKYDANYISIKRIECHLCSRIVNNGWDVLRSEEGDECFDFRLFRVILILIPFCTIQLCYVLKGRFSATKH